MANSSQSSSTSRWVWIATIIAAIVTAGGAVTAAIITSSGNSSDKKTNAQASSTSPPQSATILASSDSAGATATEKKPPTSPSDSQASSGIQYLSDLKSVTGDNRRKISTLRNQGVATVYSRSLVSVNPFKEYTFEYNIEEAWSTFKATIGIDDRSPSGSVMSFQVYLDDQPAGTAETVGMWETKNIELPVTGKGRIRLFTSTVKLGTSVPYATWGDAQFVK